jgi:DnaJ-class molecular chaperone
MPVCRNCGAPISFAETAYGKLMPINADGEPHFATCSASPRNQKPAPPQDECLGCGSENVDILPGTGPHHAAMKCRDCGQHRWLRKPAETTT